MSIYSGKFSKSTGGFLVFLVIMKMFGKMLSIWFGYQLSKEWEAGPDTYQDFNPSADNQAAQPYQAEQGSMAGGVNVNTGMPKVVHPSGPDSATIPAYQQGGGYQGGMQ